MWLTQPIYNILCMKVTFPSELEKLDIGQKNRMTSTISM